MNYQVLLFAILVPCVISQDSELSGEYGPPAPYSFGYKVHDKDGDQWRSEISDGYGKVEGSYGYLDTQGMQREVHYVADDGGFRARIKTNEPGMDIPNPADVIMEADPPSDYDATIYGVENITPDFRSNLLESHSEASPYKTGLPNAKVTQPEPKGYYKYHRFAEPSVPPIYVVDGHLQSPWFPMDTVAII